MATKVDVELLFSAVIKDAIAGINEVSSKIDTLGTRTKSFGDGMTSVGQSMLTSVTLPIVGGLAAAVKVAGDFEASMNKVAAVTGASGGDFESLRVQARELGATTQYSASQAADAMGFLGMAGFDTAQIMEAMPSTLSLAAAGNLDLARTADIASNILTGFGLEADQMSRVADVLAEASASANTDVRGLGYAMKYAAPIASATGQNFEEMVAIVGKLSDAGIQGETAGTTLRGAMARLITPTSAVSDKLKELGVTVSAGEGRLRSMVDIVRDLELAGADAADIYTIFGVEAGTGMAALVGQGSAAIRELAGDLSNAEGSASTMANTMNQGLNGQLRTLKSALEELALSIADTGILNLATQGIAIITKIIRWMSQLPPPILNTIVVIALVVAAVAPLLIIIGSVISAIGTIISALGVAIPYIITVVIPAILKIWTTIAGFFTLTNLITIAIGIWIYNIWQYAANWDDAWLGIKYTASQTWGWLKSTWADVWLGMTYTADQGWALIKDVWLGMTYTYETVIAKLDSLTNGAVSRILDAFKSILTFPFDMGYKFMEAFANGITSGGKIAVSAVSSVASKMRDYLPFSPAKVGPLSDIDKSGNALVQTISQGINASPIEGALNGAFGGLAPAVAGGGASSSTSINLVYQPTINSGGEDLVETLRNSARELLDMLRVEDERIGRGRF